jgi:signal transduction histidine kinase
MTLSELEIPENFLCKWQKTTDVMAEIFEVPAGLIMRVLPRQIEVLVSSHSPGNPYEAEEKASLNTGLYCETVMSTRAMLSVPNALQDPHWQANPDVKLNMISYLGVPLLWTEEEVFGTICVLDSKTRNHQARYVELLWEIKKSIEADFKLIQHQERLIASNIELRHAITQQRSDAVQLQRANRELNTALKSLTAMQAELLRSEKLAGLGSLVVGIAHELNTPIGNCLMAASTLQERGAEFEQQAAQGLTRAGMNQFVQTVRQGAEILMRGLGHAAELVGRFKQLSVDPSGMQRGSFLLTEAMAEIIASLRPMTGTADLVCQIPAELMLDSFPVQLSQVISSLVGNALLHGFAGRPPGTVTVTAEAAPDNRVRITVCDDGVGIPAASLGRVFDPFFTTRLGHGGSGLGLHIAYNLVHNVLGGTIEVRSEAGQGACFTLLLPRVAPQRQAAPLETV